mgnify:CR=1 FL=1
MSKRVRYVVIAIIAVVIIFIISLCIYIVSKIGKVRIEELDETNLDINDNLYNEIDSSITEQEFNDILTLVFFGTDSRDIYDMSQGRSDSIIVVSINPKIRTIKLISIPRDTYVNIPGYGYTKINHAYAYGGEQLSIKTINSNFGLNIKEYVTIDFSGLINVINSVGGIEMDITEQELEVLNHYLPASYKTSGREYKKMTEYGHVVLNGEEALAHSRDRYVGSDFDRATRQRKVLEALFNKLSEMKYSEILNLLNSYLQEVKTNINITEYLKIVMSIFKNKDEYSKNIISVQVPSTDYSSGQMIDGIYYFVPDIQKSKQDMLMYIYDK